MNDSQCHGHTPHTGLWGPLAVESHSQHGKLQNSTRQVLPSYWMRYKYGAKSYCCLESANFCFMLNTSNKNCISNTKQQPLSQCAFLFHIFSASRQFYHLPKATGKQKQIRGSETKAKETVLSLPAFFAWALHKGHIQWNPVYLLKREKNYGLWWVLQPSQRPIFQSPDIQFQLCLTFCSQDILFKSRIQSRWTLLLQRWILSFFNAQHSTCVTHWPLTLLKGEETSTREQKRNGDLLHQPRNGPKGLPN
jgi:hypothetical protein